MSDRGRPAGRTVGQSDFTAGAPTFGAPAWLLGDRELAPAGRPLVMGILNLTPDSFHAPSRFGGAPDAAEAARTLVAGGADLLDLGAESSRPGAEAVGAAEERRRLLPALRAVRRAVRVPLTVDTTRASTARLALDEGADGINDISAGGADPAMLPLAAERGCGLILMHMRGEPRTMQDAPRYTDAVAEVSAFLADRARAAEQAGVERRRICVDPGIGFGKLLDHNLELMAGLSRIAGGRPLLLGASRKRFVADLCGPAATDRLGGSLAALAAAYRGGAAVVRVHDVAASVQFLDTLAAIDGAGGGAWPAAAMRGSAASEREVERDDAR